jgi:hypothetical protein
LAKLISFPPFSLSLSYILPYFLKIAQIALQLGTNKDFDIHNSFNLKVKKKRLFHFKISRTTTNNLLQETSTNTELGLPVQKDCIVIICKVPLSYVQSD